MFDEERTLHVMARVEVPYHLRFIPSILDWAAQMTTLSGGRLQECNGLRLALEETLTFLINSYHDAEPWEMVCAEFGMRADGMVQVVIANVGPPIHLDRIPVYDPQSPGNSDMEGLWYFLALESVDGLEFKNQGRDGWRVVISKRIAQPVYATTRQTAEDSAPEVKRLDFLTRKATPEDAGALMDLIYATYRYSYPGEDFYDSATLGKALEKGELISSVVETGGVIVGTYSMILSQDAPRCLYLCSLMVRPDFRKTRAIAHIIKEVACYVESNPLGMDVFYSSMVTAHEASQKVAHKVGLEPLALLLDINTTVDFRGFRTAERARESMVLYAKVVKSPAIHALYFPERHHAVMRPLLEQLGCHAPLGAEEAAVLPDETLVTVKVDTRQKTALMTMNQLGQDWMNVLRKKLFSLRGDDVHAILLFVPVTKPIPQDMDTEMAKQNCIFTGLKPVSDSEYYSVYYALNGPVSFDAIQLADPLARDLKAHVQMLYNDTVGTL